jgi:putative mRNA 3-end processing factor
MAPLLRVTPAGLYCEAGDFYVDPWRTVPRAVITHAHSDHARRGMGRYLCSEPGRYVLQSRMGAGAEIDTLPFGASTTINGVRLSFHPAGHVLGSAQVRVEHQGEVWVVSGDYKLEPDATCHAFEPIGCHTFISESTFGLPVYRWPSQDQIKDQIAQWWRGNQQEGRTSLLMGYSLGKAQRLIGLLDEAQGPIYTHGSVEILNEAYRAAGIKLPPTQKVHAGLSEADFNRGIVIAPPSVQGTPWTRKFGHVAHAFASGWMAIRGARRRNNVERGFVVSDHVDWPGLMRAIKQTGCERVLVTHGYSAIVVRYLREQGYDAAILETEFRGETAEDDQLASEEAVSEEVPSNDGTGDHPVE